MASPFAVFRKYQALLLVVFGVLIIVVFTIGDSVSRMASDGGGEQRDEVVVRWDGTKLKQSRLQGIQLGRRICPICARGGAKCRDAEGSFSPVSAAVGLYAADQPSRCDPSSADDFFGRRSEPTGNRAFDGSG